MTRNTCKQNGTALVISLVFLLLLTIIGITAVSTATLEEKMSGNMKDQFTAFHATESALRFGENWLRSQLPPVPETVASGGTGLPVEIWTSRSPGDYASRDSAWWAAFAEEYGAAGVDIPEVQEDPRFVIEHQAWIKDDLGIGSGPETGRDFYRVTARGTGATIKAQSVLQSTVGIRW